MKPTTSPNRKSTPDSKPHPDPSKDLTGATHVCYEVMFDCSASMMNMPTAPAALQKFVNDQRNFAIDKKLQTNFTLTTFHTVARSVPDFTNVDLKTTGVIPRDELAPKCSTRLIDTALERIAELRRYLEERKPSPDSDKDPTWLGIFVLLTDGQDNQSVHTAGELKREIIKLTDEGVHCYFLGANQDAIQTGEGYGFNAGQALTYAGEAATHAMDSASQNIMSSLTQPTADRATSSQKMFTQLQREISGGTQATVPLYSNRTAPATVSTTPETQPQDYSDTLFGDASPPRLTRQLAGGAPYIQPPLTPPAK